MEGAGMMNVALIMIMMISIIIIIIIVAYEVVGNGSAFFRKKE